MSRVVIVNSTFVMAVANVALPGMLEGTTMYLSNIHMLGIHVPP